VPFFVGGRNALVEGIGERVRPIDVVPRLYAVLKPAASLDTKAVFAHPDLVRDSAAAILAGSFEDAVFGRNDLQPVAERLEPEVAQAARWLQDRFGESRMTGSGSAVFSRVGAGGDAPATPSALPAGWAYRLCRGLSEHPLLGWADD
jgi:4-diphosphocytidyl-2-C-methyl-D-erythritol kinase